MVTKYRPLWQLLMESALPHRVRQLSCSECFEIIEFLAETLPRTKGKYEQNAVEKAMQRHLKTCGNCNAYYLEQISKFEKLEKIVEGNKKG